MSSLSYSSPNSQKLVPSIHNRVEADHYQGTPQPDDRDDQPCGEETFPEYVLAGIHGQGPQHPVAEERGSRPDGCNATPALELQLGIGIAQFGDDLDVSTRNSRVAPITDGTSVDFKREPLFPEIGPVEVLWLKECDDD